jgi:4-amino-4-deoxy-L-arabinose transferase-like glycosyltransferase
MKHEIVSQGGGGFEWVTYCRRCGEKPIIKSETFLIGIPIISLLLFVIFYNLEYWLLTGVYCFGFIISTILYIPLLLILNRFGDGYIWRTYDCQPKTREEIDALVAGYQGFSSVEEKEEYYNRIVGRF